jgi:ribonucleoside-diphosphate reductase alpha chain
MTLEPPLQLHNAEEKKKLLNVSTLSDVEETYSLSALKILKERYLLKDSNGNTVERPHELLARVAVGVGIMELLYDEAFYHKDKRPSIKNRFYERDLKRLQDELKDLDYKDINEHPLCIKLPFGFIMNPFHYERLLARYIELWNEGRMNVSFSTIIYDFVENKDDLRNRITSFIQRYYDLMANCIFLPNTPALMNCGTKLGMNAACFTLAIKDDLDHIYKTNWDVARIFKSGGGIGINYSSLRPEGAFVKGTGGKSSGTLSWLRQTDETTGRVAQGGKRRGASMGILNIEHPEIERFIEMKSDNKSLLNHNISVCAPDTFFENAIAKNKDGGRASHLFDKIVRNAWISGDPGMVFLDNMNSNNLLESVMESKIDVTNPCSEISMYPYESCILASINLSKFVDEENNRFNFHEFTEVVKTVTQFLDSMIDATKYPIREIDVMTKSCRRIGVGFMGLADTLVQLGIPYNSREGFEFTERVSRWMTTVALDKSNELAKQKGAFPLWYHNRYPKEKSPALADRAIGEYKQHGLRNCSVTTVAPTGTLSMLTDCSSGIEPLFSLRYTKKVTLGEFEYLDRNYEKALKDGKLSEKDIKRIFVTAMDIHPYDHLMMQAVAQKWITNGISKTINMTSDVTEKMIEYAYVLSWALGNKGISIYRDGCKGMQVLNSDTKSGNDLQISEYTRDEIKKLNNIPESYKQELLNHEHKFAVAKWVTQDIFIARCEGCGASNTLQNNGSKSCFICVSCGHRIGSCN